MRRVAAVIGTFTLFVVTACSSTGSAEPTNPPESTTVAATTSSEGSHPIPSHPTTSVATTLRDVRVDGPDSTGSPIAVEAAIRAWRGCWDDTAPSEYQLSIATASFALLPAVASHVVDGAAISGDGAGDRRVTMSDVWVDLDGLLAEQPDAITVEFDADRCYPTRVAVDFNSAAEDDWLTYQILMQPGGRPEGRQVIGAVARIEYADVTDQAPTVIVLDDGTSFLVSERDHSWRECRRDTLGCGALAILDESGIALYAMALYLDDGRTHWRIPTVGVLDMDADPLVLWEGPILHRAEELDTSNCPFGSIQLGEGTATGSEVLVDTSSGLATGYACS